MQITNQNNNINFTSTFLNNVHLRNANGSGKLIKGFCSRLGEEDLERVRKICENWNVAHNLAPDFYRDFYFFNTVCKSNNVEFNALELAGKGHLGERIVALMESNLTKICGETSIRGETFFINPNLSSKNQTRKIKGIGEVFLSRLFTKAREADADYIKFSSSSSAIPFYKKVLKRAGIDVAKNKYFDKETCRFYIPKAEFDKYIDFCRKKYNTDFSLNA